MANSIAWKSTIL